MGPAAILAPLQGALILTLTVLVALDEWTGWAAIAPLKHTVFVVLMVLLVPIVPRARLAFVALALAIVASLPFIEADWARTISAGIDTAAFVGAFFTALTCLHTVAIQSPSIKRAGAFLAAQRPGRRYLALTVGSQGFTLLLNYGALQVLGSLALANAHKEPDQRIRAIRIRRMLLAINRGVVSTLPWSPTSFAIAICTTVVPSVTWSDVVGPSLVTAFITAGVGLALDTLFKPKVQQPSGARPVAEGNWVVLAPLGLLLLLLVVGVASLYGLTNVGVSGLVMVIVPLIGLGWMVVQTTTSPATGTMGSRLSGYVSKELPSYSSELVLLCMAGFIGTAGSAVLEPLVGMLEVDLGTLPTSVLLVAFVWLIPLAGQFGMNPILVVTLIAPLIPSAAQLGVQPEAIVLAMTAGWALSGATSPFTATTLLVARLGGVTARTVGLRWNGVYTLLCASLLSAWVLVFAFAL
ncbi:MAG: hypothetical protein AAGJ94_10895 [Pseudomonadota bacterium]